jgi:retron-type reverse transcriptase
MKTHNSLWQELCSYENLLLAYKKARKRKTKKTYVLEFQKNLKENLLQLRNELIFHSYNPRPLKKFTIRDPKTRKICKSDFRDRIIHHALCNIIEPILEESFIYDSYANRKNKGTLKALKRFDYFKRKVSRNGKVNGWFNTNQVKGYCLKADIKHYFDEVSHEILLATIKKKIKDQRIIWLIKKILDNFNSTEKGMPLGNLTSQFFANVYLTELDYFVKHNLNAKYYIRYVDDFVILYNSKNQLVDWKQEINNFLKIKLKLELHPDKTRIISLNKPISFVGFRVFYHYKLPKKFNINNIQRKLKKFHRLFLRDEINYDQIYDSMQGSFAYLKHSNTYAFRKGLREQIEGYFPNEISSVEVNRYLKYIKISSG